LNRVFIRLTAYCCFLNLGGMDVFRAPASNKSKGLLWMQCELISPLAVEQMVMKLGSECDILRDGISLLASGSTAASAAVCGVHWPLT